MNEVINVLTRISMGLEGIKKGETVKKYSLTVKVPGAGSNKKIEQWLGNSKIKKPVILDKQAITDFLSTRSRSRTGTVSHRCLRPARLPIPPSGQISCLKES